MALSENTQAIAKLRSIFKYMSFDKGLIMLRDTIIHFSSPMTFNDPFDCCSSLIEISDNTIIQILKQSEYGTLFLLPEFEKSPQMLRFIEDARNQHSEAGINEYLKNVKISCFSEKKHTLLLWSHYAHNHTGICIELDIPKLIGLLSQEKKGTIYPLKVIYSDTRSNIIYDREINNDQILRWLSVKSKEWEYEQEIRLVRPSSQENSLQITSDIVKHVYLGAKISEEHEKQIIDICKKQYPNTMVSKTSISRKEYLLEEQRLL